MAICVVCGKAITGKRTGAKTCSNACRSKSYYRRKMAERQWKDCNLDLFDQEDLKHIGRISFDMAEMVIRVANLNGREVARQLIDSIADLLVNSGVNWKNE